MCRSPAQSALQMPAFEADPAICSHLVRMECNEMAASAVSSHLLNVDCSPLGDVQGDVLLRGGSRGAAAAVQLGCARQDLHIQTTCDQTHTCTDRQTDPRTDRRTDGQTYRQADLQTQTGRSRLTSSTRGRSSEADQTCVASACCA